MQYSERLPVPLPTRSLVIPLVALLIGAAAATGAYALVDNGDEIQSPNVVVVEQPPPSRDIELRGSKASATGLAGPEATTTGQTLSGHR